jgi:2-aminoadipate transaminase
VVQLNTFSKILTPGLRVGWVVGPEEVISRLVIAKQGADLHTSSLSQVLAYELARDGFLEKHIPVIRALYLERRNAMLSALESYFPDNVRWTHPQGGLFLWITLPEHMDATRLLAEAMDYHIAFVPGSAFHPVSGGQNTLRLSFSNVNPEQIDEAIKRLGKLLHTSLARV